LLWFSSPLFSNQQLTDAVLSENSFPLASKPTTPITSITLTSHVAHQLFVYSDGLLNVSLLIFQLVLLSTFNSIEFQQKCTSTLFDVVVGIILSETKPKESRQHNDYILQNESNSEQALKIVLEWANMMSSVVVVRVGC
jgi:hypothetical protein